MTVIILDYCSGSIYKKNITKDTIISDGWLRKYGLKESQCSWMVIQDDNIEIQTLED